MLRTDADAIAWGCSSPLPSSRYLGSSPGAFQKAGQTYNRHSLMHSLHFSVSEESRHGKWAKLFSSMLVPIKCSPLTTISLLIVIRICSASKSSSAGENFCSICFHSFPSVSRSTVHFLKVSAMHSTHGFIQDHEGMFSFQDSNPSGINFS